jgi:hypothetical protein
MRQSAPWIMALAEGWVSLLGKGIDDASVKEMWKESYGKAPPPTMLELVQDNLPAIQRCIRDMIGEDKLIHTVAREWYIKPANREHNFRDLKPVDMAEALLVIPIGSGKKRYGIRLAESDNDIAWKLMTFHSAKSHGMAWKRTAERLGQGKLNGHLTAREAKTMIIELLQMLPPDDDGLKLFGKLWNGIPNPFDTNVA